MSSFSEYIPLSGNQSSVSLETPVTAPLPDAFISPAGNKPPIIDNSQSSFGDYIDAPTLQEKMTPVTFDWDKAQTDRFKESRHFMAEGFNPYAGYKEIEGKPYDVNELKYAGVQTWGDVMSNAVGGSLALAKNTFVEGWKGWANIGNAFTTIGTDRSFMDALAGSPEDLMEKDREQKAIFNKYAIFKSPVYDSNLGIFNREMIGDMIQQTGFSIGAGAQFLTEMALTWGIGKGLGMAAKGAGLLAKGLKATEEGAEAISMAERTAQMVSKGEVINDARMIADPTSIKDYGKKLMSWAGDQLGDVTGIRKMTQAYEAGASNYQLAAMGVGGITRFAAAFNSAATEARFEAANTYGQLYADLVNEWQDKNNGQVPVGADLERIKKTAYAAATDNFVANTSLLMAFNAVEFGNIMNKFGSSSRIMREALEQGEGELFTVTGKLRRDIASEAGGAGIKEGQKATKAYLKGTFGTSSVFNEIRKDFGLGTALWQVAKRSPATKLELAEGLQEILQNVSDSTFTDYYTNLYHGGKDIDGNSFVKDLTSADWGKGLQSQLSMEGWQTFLMGAATGLFIAPIQSASMGFYKKANAAINKQYQGEVDAHKKVMEDNLKILNTWYSDPSKVFNEHINGLKVQGKADKNMQEALQKNDRYEFNNAKDDAFTNAVSTAIKTGTYKSFVTSIKELGERLTDEQFEQAFGLKASSTSKVSAKQFTQGVVKDIEKYYDNWQKLKDRFAYTIQPELYAKDSKAYKDARVAKMVLDHAIEVLATTSHHADSTIKRALEIRAKSAAVPGIGSSVNKSFDVMGNINQASTELNALRETLENLEGLKNDPLVSAQIKNIKEQEKHLENWIQAYDALQSLKERKIQEEGKFESAPLVSEPYKLQEKLKEAYINYIAAVNSQYDKNAPVLDRAQINEMFNNLMDYNALHRDNGKYVQALNTLTNPTGFALLHQRLMDSANKVLEKIKKEHEKEVKRRAAASTGTQMEEEEEGEDQDEEITDVPESFIPTKVKDELVRYYTETEYKQVNGNYVEKEELEKDAKEWLDQHPELNHTLESKYINAPKGKLTSEEVESIIKDYYIEQQKKKEEGDQEETEEQKAKRLAKEESIKKAEQKKKLQSEWAKELEDSKKQINEKYTELRKTADDKDALGIQWNKELNSAEAAINEKYAKLIADLETQPGTSTGELVLTPEEEKAIGATKKDGKWYLDGKFDEPVEEGYIRELLDAYRTATGKGEDLSDIESFETEKGSIYTYDDQGRTTRFKTATGEQKLPQDLTVFVKFESSEQEQDFLAAVQDKTGNTKVYVIDSKGNKYNTNESIKGKDVRLAVVNKDGNVINTAEVSTYPVIGYNTFDQRRFTENGESYREAHIGNKVTKINRKKASDDIAAKRAEIEFAIKQLEDDLQARIDDFIAKGASKEEAEKLALDEFPKADKKALDELKSKLAALGKEEAGTKTFTIDKTGNREVVKGSSLDEIRKIYAGGTSYFNINATGEEVAETLKKGNISAEELFSSRNSFGGKLSEWFERGFKSMTGKSYDEYFNSLEKQSITKTSLEGLPKMEILDSQVSVAAHRLEDIKTGRYTDTVKQAEQRLANILAPLSQADLDEGLSLVVTERPLVGADIEAKKAEVEQLQKEYNFILRDETNDKEYNAALLVFNKSAKSRTDANILDEALLKRREKYKPLKKRAEDKLNKAKEELAAIEKANALGQPIKGNEVIYTKPQKYSMQLRYNNQPIGYLTNAGFYVFKIDGQELNVLQLSLEQFEKLMEIPEGMSPYEAFEKFKEDYKIATAIQIAIEKHLAAGKDTFSGTELQDLLSIRPVITLDYVNSSRPAPLVEDLQTSVDLPIGESGETRMVVIDNARYQEVVDELKGTGEFETVSSSEYAPMVLGEMSDLDSAFIKTAGEIPSHNATGMYSIAIQVAGQVRWIQATPSEYKEEELQTVLDRITELTSKETRTEDEVNEISSLLKTVFIALPVYEVTEGKKQKKADQQWTFSLYYSPSNNAIGIIARSEKKAKEITLGTAKFAKPEDLAAAIQKEISKNKKGVVLAPGVTVTKENFKHQVPFTTSIEEKRKAILGMRASVYSNVAKRISLRYGLPVERINSTLPIESEPSIENTTSTPVETLTKAQQRAQEKTAKQEAEQQAAESGDLLAMEKVTKSSKGKKNVRKKVAPKNVKFDEKSVENIQKFVAWVKKNLPEDIFSVEELSRLENAMYGNYVTVGQFVAHLDTLNKIKGTIEVTESSPFKYHEAFHGIFRLLLPQNKIDELLAQAKKEAPATTAQLKELRDSDPIYQNMSDKELEERFYEEYLADKFDSWKMNRNTPVPGTVKAFFQKLMDIIKRIFAKISGNKLKAMFYEIEAGRYKNARLQVNSFTDKIQEGISDPALKLIKLESDVEIETEGGIKTVDRYLPQHIGDQLSSNIAALFHIKVQESGTYNKKELLNSILDIYKNTYDISLPIYKSRARAITDIPTRTKWMKDLIDLKTVFTEEESRNTLMEAVDLHLQIMGYKQELDDEDTASLEDQVGPRNTEDAHKKTKSPLSDYASLSKYLREYIGSTTYQLDKDEYGNSQLFDKKTFDALYDNYVAENGEEPTGKILEDIRSKSTLPIYNTVSANKVYNGMLAILSNVTDEEKLINKMKEYIKHEGNPETSKFINRLLGPDGVDLDFATNTPRKNSLLLQQVLKGFNQYSTQYLFIQISQNHNYQTSYANTKDAAKVQFSNWKAQYDSLKNIKTFAVTKLVNQMSNNETEISDTDLDKFAKYISISLQKETGIALHEMFIKFSIIASKKEDVRRKEQNEFYNLYSNVEPIILSALKANLESPLSKRVDIFAKDTESDDVEKISTSKPHQFLMKIAASNALFDETINTISFTNANNETVYAHQLPNFDFVKVRELNDQGVRQVLMKNPEFANFLLSDPKFVTLAKRNKLSVEQIDGIRKVYESVNDETGEAYINKALEKNRQPGITYGDFNKREFIATLLGLYDIRKQPDALVRNDNNTEQWYVVPVMTRTIEAKNSAHLVRMAVIHSVEKTKTGSIALTQSALDKLYQFVVTEFNNIKEAKKVIDEIDNGTYTGKVIKNYHTGEKKDDGTWEKVPRGLKFFNCKLPLGSLAEEIENNLDQELDEVKIKQQLNKYWMSQVEELATEMSKEGLINLKKENGKITRISNILAPDFIFQGYEKTALNEAMNIKNNDPLFNLAQIFMNDYINTVAINQLVLGNEAKSFKDPIDQVKRMAGANAQGPSMYTGFTATELGINHALPTIHHVTYSDNAGEVISSISGAKIQSDDGQMYGTAKGLRYALFGFGKLTKVQADIITKLEQGIAVTEKEFFNAGGLKDKGAFNSLKLVYYNGSTYLKCSMIPLFREMVSVWDGDEWQPQIGKEEAHELLNKMEDYEERNNTVVFAHPESVSKGIKINVADSIDSIRDDNFNTLDSRFMRQQLENPSNKIVITDPSQAKQQIMSEQDPSTPVMFFGQMTTVGKVREAYMADNAQRVKNNYSSAANTIFNLKDAIIELDKSIKNKEFTPKMGAFFDTMRETLRATGADQQTIAFLETKDGKPVYNLNFPSTLSKFTSIFLNYFSKGIVAEKVPGQTLALVSGAMGIGDCLKRVIDLDENGQPKEWEVIPRKEYIANFRKYKNAKRWENKDTRLFAGLKKGDYYIDSLRHNVPVYDKQGNIIGRFSEYMAPAHYREEMRNIPKSLRDAFGIRIPSDDKHSYIALRKVDTLPVQYGSVGVFPHELIEISGADFDIDKMYLTLADTYPVYDDNSQVALEYKDLKQRIKSHLERRNELNVQWRSLSSYSSDVAERSKEIKDEIKKLDAQYEAGLIQESDYTQRVDELNEEKDSLGTKEGIEERRPIVAEIKRINEDLKKYNKKAEKLKEELDNSATRVAYGSATNNQEEFDEFLKWQETNNKAFKAKLKELSSLYNNASDDFGDIDSDVRADLNDLYAILNLDSDALLYKTALTELGLPSDPIEFYLHTHKEGKKVIELNNGVLNNRSLAAKLAMQSNENIVKINSTSTSTKPLLNLTKELIKLFNNIQSDESIPYDQKRGIDSILNVLEEKTTDVNSLIGKAASFDNNKQGSRNIGATANAIQVYSLLNQYGVTLPEKYTFEIDGNLFNSFGHDKEWLEYQPEPFYHKNGNIKGYIIDGQKYSKKDFDDNNVPKGEYNGERIAANLGTLLNAMTDNAKERLAARLGLNITALGYVSNMVSTGVPLKTAVLIVLQPAARRYFADVQRISGSIKTEEESKKSKKKLLNEQLQRLDPNGDIGIGEANLTTTQDLIDNITAGGTKVSDAWALKVIRLVDEQSTTLANISKIQKLSQGLPTTWEEVDEMNSALNNLGIKLDGDRYVEMSSDEYISYLKENDQSPSVIDRIDIADILLNKQKIIATNLKVLGQVQYLAKKIFIEKTPLFKRLSELTFSNMRKMSPIEKEEFNRVLKNDIISFLSIKAYLHWLNKNDRPDTKLSLDNAMIYPELKKNKPVGYKDIVDILTDLREKLTGKNENYLVSKFLMTTPADESKEGINTAEANTWARLSDAQQDRLISSFISLYVNAYTDAQGNEINTHDSAVALFNYLLVKDGGQFKSGSFVRFMPTFMFEDIMGRTTEINDFLSNDKWNEEKSMSLFGVHSSELMNDFIKSYGSHIGNKYYIKSIVDNKGKSIPDNIDKSAFTPEESKRFNSHIIAKAHTNPVDIEPDGDPLIYIDMFRGIRDTVVPNIEGTYVNRKYGKKFTDFEKALLVKNINYIKASNLNIIEKEVKGETRSQIEFPYYMQINGALYELFALGEDVNNMPSHVIPKGDTIATGTSAQYRKIDWKGAPSTFKAQGVFGALPVSKIQPVSKTKTVITDEDIEVEEETDQQPEISEIPQQKTPLERLAELGITRIATSNGIVAIKDGKQYPMRLEDNTPAKVIARIQELESASATGNKPVEKDVEITKVNYTREEVRKNPDTAYVFTENTHSIMAFPDKQGGGSAIIRPEPNAFAIVTKKKYDYNTKENVDYTDTPENFKEFVNINTKLIENIKNSGKSKIVFPQGFATDKAMMPTRFAEWLQKALLDNFGLVTELNDTKTGLISKSVIDKNITVKPTIDLSKEWKGDLESRPVYTKEGVNTMRTSAANINENFGNPFSATGYAGTIKVATIGEAISNYKDWLLGNKFKDIKPEQRAWILNQINQGKLDGAILLYAGKLEARGEGMHPTALAEVVEQLRKGTTTEEVTEAPKTGRWTPEQWKTKVDELYSKGMYLFASASGGAAIIDRTKLTPEEFSKRANAAIKELRDRGISDDNSIFEALSCPF